jgi:surfactin synthase thioesterase subunit
MMFLGGPAPRAAEVTVYCLPNAGGAGSAFAGWRQVAPDWLWVQPVALPGRENRIAEPPEFDVDELAGAIARHVDRPYWLYGHSMGGVLALEIARRLTETRSPQRLYVGASQPPHVVSDWTRRWAEAGDDELLREVAVLGGVPEVVLGHPRARRQVVRVLRADVTWLAAQRSAVPLPVPLTAIAGARDPLVRPEVMARWADLSPDFGLAVVPGGHLFHMEEPRAVVGALLTAAGRSRCA